MHACRLAGWLAAPLLPTQVPTHPAAAAAAAALGLRGRSTVQAAHRQDGDGDGAVGVLRGQEALQEGLAGAVGLRVRVTQGGPRAGPGRGCVWGGGGRGCSAALAECGDSGRGGGGAAETMGRCSSQYVIRTFASARRQAHHVWRTPPSTHPPLPPRRLTAGRPHPPHISPTWCPSSRSSSQAQPDTHLTLACMGGARTAGGGAERCPCSDSVEPLPVICRWHCQPATVGRA